MRFWFKFHVSKNIFSKNIKYLNQLLTSGILMNRLYISCVLERAWKKENLKPAEVPIENFINRNISYSK